MDSFCNIKTASNPKKAPASAGAPSEEYRPVKTAARPAKTLPRMGFEPIPPVPKTGTLSS